MRQQSTPPSTKGDAESRPSRIGTIALSVLASIASAIGVTACAGSHPKPAASGARPTAPTLGSAQPPLPANDDCDVTRPFVNPPESARDYFQRIVELDLANNPTIAKQFKRPQVHARDYRCTIFNVNEGLIYTQELQFEIGESGAAGTTGSTTSYFATRTVFIDSTGNQANVGLITMSSEELAALRKSQKIDVGIPIAKDGSRFVTARNQNRKPLFFAIENRAVDGSLPNFAPAVQWPGITITMGGNDISLASVKSVAGPRSTPSLRTLL